MTTPVKFLLTLTLALAISVIAKIAYAPVVSDVPSSKNEIVLRGSSPHVKFIDETGTGDFQTIVNGGVFKLDALSASKFFNVPNAGTFGIELDPPSSITVTPFTSGGFLVDGTYYIKITALDVGGETIGSAEQTCLISGGGGSGRCYISWVASPPPAANYRVYVGLSPEAENVYFATGGAINYNLTTMAGTAGTPPAASTAYQVKLKNNGIHFPDGTSQLTAAGSGAWMFLGLHILNTTNGNVGIFDGSVWTPDAKLTVKCTAPPCGIDINDHGAILDIAVDDFQIRSNYKISTATLWDTLKSSWAIVAGGSGDFFRVYRAPATAGFPAYAEFLTLDLSSFTINGGSVSPFTFAINAPTVNFTSPSAISFRVKGLSNAATLVVDASTPFPAELELDIASVKKAGFGTAPAIPQTTWLYYDGTLNFQSPYANTVAYLTNAGVFHANATIDSGNNLTATNRVQGGAMGKACVDSDVTILGDGTVVIGLPVIITTGGVNSVYVVASFLGSWYADDRAVMSIKFYLERNGSVNIGGTDGFPSSSMVFNPVQAGGSPPGDLTSQIPLSATLQSIDYPGVASPTSYNMKATTAGVAGGSSVGGRLRICAFEIP